MALANFFDKTALGASQILNNYNREAFEKTLNDHHIAIVFGKNATDTHEGSVALDLIIRLGARLYPNLQLINTTGDKKKEKELLLLAKKINPVINLEKKLKPTIFLIAGRVKYDTETEKVPTYHIGANSWNSKFSLNKNKSFGKSFNPFGSAVAVCFALANIFRTVFKHQLPHSSVDNDFAFSVLNLTKNVKKSSNPKISNVNIEEWTMVGAGAIGNAVIWALNQSKKMISSGSINIIDNQEVDITNLQRYLLTTQESKEKDKVSIAKEYLKESKIEVTEYKYTWQEYIGNLHSWKVQNIISCVDSANDRIAIQGALPKTIINAWTQQESIGISRHFDFINEACLACLYLPTHKKSSKSEDISRNLGIMENEIVVRNYLAEDKPVDENLLELVAKANKKPVEELKNFIGLNVDVFHSKVICGGILMSQNTHTDETIEVPSAFESALAGILIASEIIIYSSGLRKKNDVPNSSRINLMRPISNYINQIEMKHHLGKCICQDKDFQKAYNIKWTV